MTATAPKTERPFVLVSIMLAMFMIAIEATIVATAMPDIVARLGGFSLYSWVFAGFLLTQTATTVLFGKLADLYGRRPILIGGIVVFLAGSLLCGFATNMVSLIAFRLLQGLGAGAIQPVAMTIVADLYSPQERASIQGYLSSVWGVSAIIGPLVGGLIVEKLSWPWVFWINLPVGVATMIMLSKYLHEGVERKRHSIDILGASVFAIGISSLLMVLNQIGQPGANHFATVGFGILFLISVPLFFWQERRAKEPMLDLGLWTDRLVASVNGSSLAAGMTLMGVTSFLAVYVQGVMGHSATVAGLALTMMALGWPIASVVTRKFYARIGMRGTLRLGSILIVVGASFFLFLSSTSSPIFAGVGSFILGFGMGLLIVTGLIMVQGSVPWQRRGSATAANVFARTLGSTLGAAILGSLLNFGLHSYSPSSGVTAESVRKLLDSPAQAALLPNKEIVIRSLDYGLHLTFWAVVVLGIVTAMLSWFIPNRQLEELGVGHQAHSSAH